MQKEQLKPEPTARKSEANSMANLIKWMNGVKKPSTVRSRVVLAEPNDMLLSDDSANLFQPPQAYRSLAGSKQKQAFRLRELVNC
ncbi:hypothetical protein AQUCO_01400580v1 [Aquilegia coerulea]|uniref:Uncharacterized protein n=1 Tax=Aquilegia coerulea TaxID=218851 RepID=A0A2G5DXA6_AQUCA|nr:hypothetical protein AQUCO_01400580v1 [Aquilegia coerulea]